MLPSAPTPHASSGATTAPLVQTAVTTAIVTACGIVTGLIAARSLGPEGRGQLAAITVWAATLLYAGSFGVTEAVAYLAASDRAERNRLWTTGQTLAIVLGASVALAGWWVIPRIFLGDNEAVASAARWYLLLFAIPSLGGTCAIAWLQGVRHMRAFNLSRATVHVLNAAGMTLLLMAGDQSVAHFAWVLLIGNGVTWIVAAAFGPVRHAPASPPSPALAKRTLHYGLRLQFGNWSSMANLRLDQLLLTLFTPAASLGLYVLAVNYATVLTTITGTAAMVMLPEMVSSHAGGQGGACLQRWYRRTLWVALAGGAVLAAAGLVIIPAVVGQRFAAAVPLAVLLMPGVLLLGMNAILSVGFRGIDRPEVESASQTLGLVVTVAALAVLLPRYGVYGAIAASLLSYGATHAYLLRKAGATFALDIRSLILPTHEDVAALRHLVWQGSHRL